MKYALRLFFYAFVTQLLVALYGYFWPFPYNDFLASASVLFITAFSTIVPAVIAVTDFRKTSRFGNVPLTFMASGFIMLLGFMGLTIFLLRTDYRRVAPFLVVFVAGFLLLTVIGSVLGAIFAYLQRKVRQRPARH